MLGDQSAELFGGKEDAVALARQLDVFARLRLLQSATFLRNCISSDSRACVDNPTLRVNRKVYP